MRRMSSPRVTNCRALVAMSSCCPCPVIMEISDITTADLGGILSTKGPTAARMHYRNLGVFWRWAAKPPRSWATLEVMQATETPRVSSDADIRILNPAEVKALLPLWPSMLAFLILGGLVSGCGRSLAGRAEISAVAARARSISPNPRKLTLKASSRHYCLGTPSPAV